MNPRVFLLVLWLSVMSFCVAGCQTITSFLPPQKCKPSADLPAEKHVPLLKEVDTSNQDGFDLWLKDRAAWADDLKEYNSLYSECVGGSDAK